mmetsp:Transcript_18418/g.51391  ORF Transcript_18418/g.51391 Transcript_18418/m.51391 type:complete len:298 (+) Transcript_18418:539-1432(+)
MAALTLESPSRSRTAVSSFFKRLNSCSVALTRENSAAAARGMLRSSRSASSKFFSALDTVSVIAEDEGASSLPLVLVVLSASLLLSLPLSEPTASSICCITRSIRFRALLEASIACGVNPSCFWYCELMTKNRKARTSTALGQAVRSVRKFPSDLDIFSSLMLTNPLWTQQVQKVFPETPSDWAISFSWWGNWRSQPPPCRSMVSPRYFRDMALHSRCHPGRPFWIFPSGCSQEASSRSGDLKAFHRAKSRGSCFMSVPTAVSSCCDSISSFLSWTSCSPYPSFLEVAKYHDPSSVS